MEILVAFYFNLKKAYLPLPFTLESTKTVYSLQATDVRVNLFLSKLPMIEHAILYLSIYLKSYLWQSTKKMSLMIT